MITKFENEIGDATPIFFAHLGIGGTLALLQSFITFWFLGECSIGISMFMFIGFLVFGYYRAIKFIDRMFEVHESKAKTEKDFTYTSTADNIFIQVKRSSVYLNGYCVQEYDPYNKNTKRLIGTLVEKLKTPKYSKMNYPELFI